MMRYNKGLSTVVTTLIIVLLVLAAIGIIWGPIKNLLGNSSSSLDQTKCLNLGFKVLLVNETDATNHTYKLILQREATGTDVKEISAKAIFYSDTDSSPTFDLKDDLAVEMFGPLDRRSTTITNTGVEATSLDIIPYYIDASTGEKKICNTPTTVPIVSTK